MKKTLGILAALTLLFGFSPSAVALTINDPGVVGYMEGQVNAGMGNVNERTIANNLLAMGDNQTVLVSTVGPAGVDCSGGTINQAPCEYFTGTNGSEYNGTLTGGIQDTTSPGTLNGAELTSLYFLAKYDGPNAGYVLFNTADWVAANGTTVPANGSTIWSASGSGLSHITYFGTRTSVPDGGTSLILLGAALAGLGMLRRRMNI